MERVGARPGKQQITVEDGNRWRREAVVGNRQLLRLPYTSKRMLSEWFGSNPRQATITALLAAFDIWTTAGRLTVDSFIESLT
jgi:hypothetical protein